MKRRTNPRRPDQDRRKATPGRFWVSGYIRDPDTLHPRRGMVTWDNGVLTGTPELVAAVTERATALEGIDTGPIEGPYTVTAHLSNQITAAVLIAELFLPGTIESGGDVPERPGIPAGATG